MIKIIYSELKEFDWDHIYNLYSDAGWIAYTNNFENLKEGIKNSLAVVGAFYEDKLVGLIRAVGDGETIVYIQDILILEEYQRLGIGTELLNIIFDKYSHVRQKILLTDDTEKTIEFYKSNNMKDVVEFNTVAFMKI